MAGGGDDNGANPFEWAKKQLGGHLNVGNNGGNWNPFNSELSKVATGGFNIPNSDQIKKFSEGDYSGLQEWGQDQLQKQLDPRNPKLGSLSSTLISGGALAPYQRGKAAERRANDVREQNEKLETEAYYADQGAQQQASEEAKRLADQKAATDAELKGRLDAGAAGAQAGSDLELARNRLFSARRGRKMYNTLGGGNGW